MEQPRADRDMAGRVDGRGAYGDACEACGSTISVGPSGRRMLGATSRRALQEIEAAMDEAAGRDDLQRASAKICTVCGTVLGVWKVPPPVNRGALG